MTNEYVSGLLTESEIAAQQKLRAYKPLVYDKMIKYDDKIRAGQSVANIQIQYGYICNMRCVHCSIHPFRIQPAKGRRRLNIDDIASISQQADELGLGNFTISGGEPTLYKDFDNVIAAIQPQKFWIQVDTNGWLFDDKLAEHWKSIGVDKIDLSLDSLDEEAHDTFRRKPGSWKRAISAIDSAQKAGISVLINTVITHSRLYSQEFKDFLDYLAPKNVAIMVCWAKPVGCYSGHCDDLATEKDTEYLSELCKKYNIFDHTTLTSYGRHVGCMIVKRLVGITQWGDVMPCPWFQASLGNIMETPLKDILEKGMRYFGAYEPLCLTGVDRKFIDTYLTKLYGKKLPIPIEEVLPENWKDL